MSDPIQTAAEVATAAIPGIASVADAVAGSVSQHQTALQTAQAANAALASSLSPVLSTMPPALSQQIGGWLALVESAIQIGLAVATKL